MLISPTSSYKTVGKDILKHIRGEPQKLNLEKQTYKPLKFMAYLPSSFHRFFNQSYIHRKDNQLNIS